VWSPVPPKLSAAGAGRFLEGSALSANTATFCAVLGWGHSLDLSVLASLLAICQKSRAGGVSVGRSSGGSFCDFPTSPQGPCAAGVRWTLLSSLCDPPEKCAGKYSR